MVQSYSQFYRQKDKHLSELVEDGLVSEDDAEAIRTLCDAFNEDKPSVKKPHWPNAPGNLTGYRKESTLANWLYYLTQFAAELELLEATADEINQISEDWLQGDSEYRDNTLSKGTIRQYQNALRIFYRYHDDLGVDHTDIVTFDANDTAIDPRDMLSPEEIERIRQAPDHPRDKAVAYLLLYTGIRNTALRSLRVKDVDVEEGVFYFNTDADGLKKVHRPTEPRPLLGAESAVRQWLEYHPYSDDPDAYLIVGKPKYQTVDPHTRVTHRTIQRIMDSVKEEAEIDKPLHPHACRHNFVSICIREYDMEPSTVKFLIGHGPDSSVMESTYQHLSGEDYLNKAQRKAGVPGAEEQEESSLTPDHCGACGEPLGPNAKACPACGTVMTPDARAAQDQLKDATREAKEDAENLEEYKDADKIAQAIDEDPELAAQLMDKLGSIAED